jgi:hypothetical protein
MLRHAVKAAQVAPVGHSQPQVVNYPSVIIEQHYNVDFLPDKVRHFLVANSYDA